MAKDFSDNIQRGIAFAIGFALVAVVVRKLRGEQEAISTSSVGRILSFPVNENSLDHVEGLTWEFLQEGRQSHNVYLLTERVLQQNGMAMEASWEAIVVLHRFMADVVPFTEDPAGMEKMTSPDEFARKVLNGEDPREDCESSACALSGMLHQLGVLSSVSFLDTNGDGVIDHAGTIFIWEEQTYFVETTIEGVSLGWEPPVSYVECLPFVS